nr:TolC family protein [Burkholderia sp. BCC1977]
MTFRRMLSGLGLALLAAVSARAESIDGPLIDLYATGSMTAAAPAAPALNDAACEPDGAARPLELEDVMLRAVCANPQVRQAWADARAQAAQVGVEEAAYLPTLNGSVGIQRDNLATTYAVPGYGPYTQTQRSTSRYGSIDLSWVLFDFGRRGFSVRRARALVAAANATHDDMLQTVLLNAAQAYYDLRAAEGSKVAAHAAEDAARESLEVAKARHDAGAGELGDELQAQTMYRRAIVDRVAAEGAVETARGTLAVAMGLPADRPIQLASDQPLIDRHAFDDGVSRLIDEAQASHPKLVAARAKLDAARANVDAVRAQGLPSIALTGSLSRNNPAYQQQPEQVPVTSSRGSSIGIRITIPLFDGFASSYRVAAARAQVASTEAALQADELQVSLDVWKSYQSLRVDTDNLDNTEALLAYAHRSLEVARGRYKAGVGTFTELMTAQTASADAEKQRVRALSEWRAARLKLAESLGNIRLESDR